MSRFRSLFLKNCGGQQKSHCRAFPNLAAHIDATDISVDALAVARRNVAAYRLQRRLSLLKSNMFSALHGLRYDLIIANPPYVGESEADKVQRQVREFEPKVAVFSGQEGMDIYRRLIPQASAALNPGGWFVTEIGFSAEEKVRQLLDGWTDVRVTADLQGIPRVMAARRNWVSG